MAEKSNLSKNLRLILTLGIIAAGSGVLVGVANAITAPIISSNAIEQSKQALVSVYGGQTTDYVNVYFDADGKPTTDSAAGKDVSEVYRVDYVTEVWQYSTSGDYVVVSHGVNGYGYITMALGITANNQLGRMVMVEDTQTYKNILEPNYVDAYNNATDKATALANVKCGATYGATLIMNMANESLGVIDGTGRKIPRPGQAPDDVKQVFGEDHVYTVDDTFAATGSLTDRYTVDEGSTGFVYVATTEYNYGFGTGEVTIDVGINADKTLGNIVYVEGNDGAGGSFINNALAYIEAINAATTNEDKLAAVEDTSVVTGASYTPPAFQKLIKEVLAYVEGGN